MILLLAVFDMLRYSLSSFVLTPTTLALPMDETAIGGSNDISSET
jgi:hypothetical protein